MSTIVWACGGIFKNTHNPHPPTANHIYRIVIHPPGEGRDK